MSLDVPLPKQVFGHPWLIMSDGKMSKSLGNVIYADDLVEEFGVDAVRYYFYMKYHLLVMEYSQEIY